MAKLLTRDTRVYIGGYDPGASTTRWVFSLEAPALDPTAITDAAERVAADIRKDAFEWAGIFDDSANDADAAAVAMIGSSTNNVVSVFLGTATGSLAYAGTALMITHRALGSLGDMVRYEIGFALDQAIERGVHYGLPTAESGGWDTGSVDNAVLTTGGGSWYLHIISGSGTVGLQDSADGTSFANIGTITGITGKIARKTALTGTIRRYTRVDVSTGTSLLLTSVLVRS